MFFDRAFSGCSAMALLVFSIASRMIVADIGSSYLDKGMVAIWGLTSGISGGPAAPLLE
jgi:hypothetical protein